MNQQIHGTPDQSHGEDIEAITRDVGLFAEVLTRAHRDSLSEIRTELTQIPSEANLQTAIVKAEVRTSKGIFHAYGDASPDSVEDGFQAHIIRVAETRAKARALRDAVNMGCTPFSEPNDVPSPDGKSGGESGGSSQPSTTSPAGSRPSEGNEASGSFIQLTDGQRRYLYRIVAARGYKGDAARNRILELFGVSEFSEISKSAARTMIDRLLREEGEPARGQ